MLGKRLTQRDTRFYIAGNARNNIFKILIFGLLLQRIERSSKRHASRHHGRQLTSKDDQIMYFNFGFKESALPLSPFANGLIFVNQDRMGALFCQTLNHCLPVGGFGRAGNGFAVTGPGFIRELHTMRYSSLVTRKISSMVVSPRRALIKPSIFMVSIPSCIAVFCIFSLVPFETINF